LRAASALVPTPGPALFNLREISHNLPLPR